MILNALWRSLPQIVLPAIRGILLRSILLTLALFAIVGIGLGFALKSALDQAGWSTNSGLAGIALAVLVTLACTWLIFRAVAMAVIGLWADGIVKAVEDASYPQRGAGARVLPVTDGLRNGMRSVLRTIGWNLAAVPVYALLLITGIGAPMVFLLVNAYLLGRDLSELVEGRHPAQQPFTAIQRWSIGFGSALLFLLPVVNLFAPIWSVAMAAHMFHSRKER